MRYLLLILLFVCCFTASFSQTPAARKHTISGYVRESGSGELLIGVTVYLPQLKTGTATNTYGFYSLTLPADSLELVAVYADGEPVPNVQGMQFNGDALVPTEPTYAARRRSL